tara:strand:+ start:126 stop:575 length:450 start_codon:yes stop_codon:yes gene_type:complete
MKIGEVVRKTGLSADTLRYYERIGLLPRIYRDTSGQRHYDPSILVWIEFLGRLKATGMPLREMCRYAELREQGASTAEARCELLEDHRDEVRAKLREIQECLDTLDHKIAHYRATLQENSNHDQPDNTRTDRDPVNEPLRARREGAGRH